VTDAPPTPHTTLSARYLDVLVWGKGGCQHQAAADLRKLVDTGHGDVPLTQLRFRCSRCGTDQVLETVSAFRHSAF
jgi:hypothetical protein